MLDFINGDFANDEYSRFISSKNCVNMELDIHNTQSTWEILSNDVKEGCGTISVVSINSLHLMIDISHHSTGGSMQGDCRFIGQNLKKEECENQHRNRRTLTCPTLKIAGYDREIGKRGCP